jgi:hypothetical protein
VDENVVSTGGAFRDKDRGMARLLPHGDVESPVSGVWLVKGVCSFPLRRNMTIWKLPDGSLVLHSVIAMDEARMAQLDRLGRVSVLLVPHGLHRRDIAFYKRRYPTARVIAPAATRAKIEEVVPVDATAEDELPGHGIKVHPLPGWKHGELAYEIALPGGGAALVLSDVLANDDRLPGPRAWFFRNVTGGIKGPLGVARIMKTMMVGDRAAARAAVERLADIPDLRFLSVAHGKPVTADLPALIREAAASL